MEVVFVVSVGEVSHRHFQVFTERIFHSVEYEVRALVIIPIKSSVYPRLNLRSIRCLQIQTFGFRVCRIIRADSVVTYSISYFDSNKRRNNPLQHSAYNPSRFSSPVIPSFPLFRMILMPCERRLGADCKVFFR